MDNDEEYDNQSYDTKIGGCMCCDLIIGLTFLILGINQGNNMKVVFAASSNNLRIIWLYLVAKYLGFKLLYGCCVISNFNQFSSNAR